MYIGMLARRLGAPLVFSTHGELSFDAQRAFERSAILRAGLRRTVRQARIVTACSTFTLKNLETFVKPECPSVVIQNGVDPEEFAHRAMWRTASSPTSLPSVASYHRRGSTSLWMLSR